jgi:hypothetical protein
MTNQPMTNQPPTNNIMKTTQNIIQPIRHHLQPLALAVGVGLGLALAPAAQAGTITVGDPLIPAGLVVGNKFHIAFQTEGTSTAATSTDIAYYNAHVQASANSAGSLFLGRGWNWYCIGSTSTVDARDNAVVSAPVYIQSKGNSPTNPLTQILVANNYTDFWDGSHAIGIYQDNDGVHGNGGPWVLTGTNTNGTRYVGYELGSALAVRLGDAWVSSSAWVSATDTLNKGSAVLYALSEPLTIVSTSVASAASTDWNIAGTWNPDAVPTATSAVTVNPHAVTIDFAQSPTPANCYSLTLSGTSSVTATNQSLTVASPLSGALDTTGGALTLDATSTLTIPKATTSASLAGLTVASGTTLNITGELTVDANKDLTGAILNTPKLTLAGGTLTKSDGLTIGSGGLISGTGTVVGAVAVASGGKVSPGSDTTIATIATNSLSLASDSLLTLNAASTLSNDQITVGTSGGLTINGGAITFLNADGTGPVTEFGTYQLIGYSGAIVGSVSSLTVANKALYTDYTFGTASNFVTLTVSQGALPVPFLSQNFDDDPVNYTNSPFVVGATDKNDYWALSNTGDGMILNPNFTDASGTYLTGQDMDGGGGLAFTTGAPAHIDFTVLATGYVDLKLSIALAGAPKAENINYVRAKLDNDGDSIYETTLFNFVGNNNSAYTDTVLGALSTAFKTFTYIALPTPTASDGNLRLRLEVFCDTNNLGVDSENIGIDNIVIAGMPVSGYTSWAATNAGGQTAEKDSNNDGVANGVAYFMNATGLATNPGINSSGQVTWPNGGNIPSSAYGTQYVVQTSSDLQTWTDVAVGAVDLTNPNEVSYTLTGASPRFVRLKVTPN